MPTIYTGILHIDGTAHETAYSAPDGHPKQEIIEDVFRFGDPSMIAQLILKNAAKTHRKAVMAATTITLQVTKHTIP